MNTGTADARPADVHELAAHPVGHDMLTCQVQRPPVVLKPAWLVILEVLGLAEVEHNAHNNRSAPAQRSRRREARAAGRPEA